MTGIERIAAERKRQIEEEGFAAEQDAFWSKGELAQAALCYCMAPPDPKGIANGSIEPCVPEEWPWRRGLWKLAPGNRISELEKAGALIAAEIDRLLRAESEGD
jgi:hypothetical protein